MDRTAAILMAISVAGLIVGVALTFVADKHYGED